MFQGVSLDQAPPFEAPLLFFLTAPILAIIGALLLLFEVGDFAILHSFSIGFLLFVMIGALQQMLPVIIGVKFERPKLLSILLYIPLLVGLALFIAALGFGKLLATFIASIVLLLTLSGFTFLTIHKLLSAPHKSDTLIAMLFALLSLLGATLLGAHLLIAIGRGEALSFLHAHGAYAGFGWVGLLIVGISYQVIPMFYVTKELPLRLKRLLAPSIFALITIYAFTAWLPIFWLINGTWIIFSVATLLQLHQRKRAIKEPTIAFWQVGLFALIVASVYGFFAQDERYVILFGYGFAMSIVYGMLYKIIPFLSWFHINSRGFFDVPTMKEMLGEKMAYLHLILHVAATLLLLFAPQIASGLIIAENLLFYYIIKKPITIYFDYKKRPSPLEAFKMS